MFDSLRVFRRSDPDFPTTRAVQQRLVAAGRVAGEGPLASGGATPRCRVCGCDIAGDTEADPDIPACGSCKARPEARPEARQAAGGAPRDFTEADKSLIRKINGYLPPLQLLGLLNDRLRSDRGPDEPPYTIEQLHAEVAAAPGAKPGARPGGDHGWAGLRKLLAQARRAGTLDRIDEQVVRDFAVVFSLSPKHMMRLKDILLQCAED